MGGGCGGTRNDFPAQIATIFGKALFILFPFFRPPIYTWEEEKKTIDAFIEIATTFHLGCSSFFFFILWEERVNDIRTLRGG